LLPLGGLQEPKPCGEREQILGFGCRTRRVLRKSRLVGFQEHSQLGAYTVVTAKTIAAALLLLLLESPV
jgi:hypothetical protein